MRIFSISLLRLTFVFCTIYYATPTTAQPTGEKPVKLQLTASDISSMKENPYPEEPAKKDVEHGQDLLFKMLHGEKPPPFSVPATIRKPGPFCKGRYPVFGQLSDEVQILQTRKPDNAMTFETCQLSSYSRIQHIGRNGDESDNVRVVVSGFLISPPSADGTDCYSVTADSRRVNPKQLGSCAYITMPTTFNVFQLQTLLRERFSKKAECGENVHYGEADHSVFRPTIKFNQCLKYAQMDLMVLPGYQTPGQKYAKRWVVTGFKPEAGTDTSCEPINVAKDHVGGDQLGMCAVVMVEKAEGKRK